MLVTKQIPHESHILNKSTIHSTLNLTKRIKKDGKERVRNERVEPVRRPIARNRFNSKVDLPFFKGR